MSFIFVISPFLKSPFFVFSKDKLLLSILSILTIAPYSGVCVYVEGLTLLVFHWLYRAIFLKKDRGGFFFFFFAETCASASHC